MQKELARPTPESLAIPNLDVASVVKLRLLVRSAHFPAEIDPALARTQRVREYIRRLESILRACPQFYITLSDLAYILDLERTYTCKAFQQITGMPFSLWLRRIRITCARRLLLDQGYTITEIAHAVGYGDITTFERNFRREIAMSPGKYRRLHRGPIKGTSLTQRLHHPRHEASASSISDKDAVL